jgi:hypothetical protein
MWHVWGRRKVLQVLVRKPEKNAGNILKGLGVNGRII